MVAQFPWLTAIILLPLLAALAIPLIPDKEGKTVRWYALVIGIADFMLMGYAFWNNYDPSTAQFQLTESYSWIPQLGVSWSVSVDGISAPLVLLAGFVTTLAMLSAWQVDRKPRLFYFLMLVLYSAQIGVFVAQDMLLLVTRTSPCLLAGFNLGRFQTSLRSHEIFTLHRSSIYIYPGSGFGNGFLRR